MAAASTSTAARDTGHKTIDASPYIKANDPRSVVVDSSYKVALALLRTEKSTAALIKIGELVLGKLGPGNSRCCTNATELPGWVSAFLEKLGKNHVQVILDRSIDRDAEFSPHNWSKGTAKNFKLAWDPKRAGDILLNLSAVNCMLMAKRETDETHRKAYNDFLFIMGAAIARQLACCFSSSLVPHGVSVGDADDLWERWTFDAPVVSYEQPRHSLGARQAGVLWLMKAPSPQRVQLPELGQQIPDVFPLPLTLGPSAKFEDVEKNSDMEDVRDEARKELEKLPTPASSANHSAVQPPKSNGGGTPGKLTASTSTSTSSTASSNARPAPAGALVKNSGGGSAPKKLAVGDAAPTKTSVEAKKPLAKTPVAKKAPGNGVTANRSQGTGA